MRCGGSAVEHGSCELATPFNWGTPSRLSISTRACGFSVARELSSGSCEQTVRPKQQLFREGRCHTNHSRPPRRRTAATRLPSRLARRRQSKALTSHSFASLTKTSRVKSRAKEQGWLSRTHPTLESPNGTYVSSGSGSSIYHSTTRGKATEKRSATEETPNMIDPMTPVTTAEAAAFALRNGM